MNQSKKNFGVGPDDARALEERLANMLSQTPDGRMNQVSRRTPGEAATLMYPEVFRTYGYFGRTAVSIHFRLSVRGHNGNADHSGTYGGTNEGRSRL